MKNSNKLYWKAVGMLEFWYAIITAFLVLLAAVVYVIYEYLPDGPLKMLFLFTGFASCIPIVMMIWIMLFTPFYCSVYYWRKSPGSDSYKEYLNWMTERGRLFFVQANPVIVFSTFAKRVVQAVTARESRQKHSTQQGDRDVQ